MNEILKPLYSIKIVLEFLKLIHNVCLRNYTY